MDEMKIKSSVNPHKLTNSNHREIPTNLLSKENFIHE
jgi:hypothetical protein